MIPPDSINSSIALLSASTTWVGEVKRKEPGLFSITWYWSYTVSYTHLIRKYEYHSNYLGIKKERTDDWCFETNGHVIKSIAVGGVDCYQMVGISYWDQNDGLKMNDDIEYVFKSPGGKEKYWDVIALDVRKKNHTLHVRPCLQEDIIEIDTFNELKEIDPIYKS